jgi:uncharacterized protein
VQGYGCGPLTKQAKQKILGGKLARLHGVDIAAKKQQLGFNGLRISLHVLPW